jgi:hypothetical protein
MLLGILRRMDQALQSRRISRRERLFAAQLMADVLDYALAVAHYSLAPNWRSAVVRANRYLQSLNAEIMQGLQEAQYAQPVVPSGSDVGAGGHPSPQPVGLEGNAFGG